MHRINKKQAVCTRGCILRCMLGRNHVHHRKRLWPEDTFSFQIGTVQTKRILARCQTSHPGISRNVCIFQLTRCCRKEIWTKCLQINSNHRAVMFSSPKIIEEGPFCTTTASLTHTHTHSYTHTQTKTLEKRLMSTVIKANEVIPVKRVQKQRFELLPTTMRVNSNPRFTDFLYTWLGRFPKPTNVSRFFCCCRRLKKR